MIRKLINWRFKGKIKIPDEYQTIVHKQRKWLAYLKRRDFITKFGVGMFILEFLTTNTGTNYFIERFYPDILEKNKKNLNTLTQQQKMEIALDLEEKIIILLNKWVDKYPKLIPKLPAFAKYLLPVQMRIYKFN
ncbi:hypothetical protein LCGC14_0508520 [marine sediment metagenome]|uniref:Uncharacterized protein n=1 Tax=marine sediment metagenome TaxID=412755 RepID=A0A0F9UNP2_9ZZZZ